MNPKRRRLFLDTEFTSLSREAHLISMALVAESGEAFYAEFTDVPPHLIEGNAWVKENVLPQLFLSRSELHQAPQRMYVRAETAAIRAALEEWLAQFGEVRNATGEVIPHLEVWADVPAYDWVFFAELFGGALHLPPTLDYIVRDLATWLQCRGIDPATPRLHLLTDEERPDGHPHNALFDARVGMRILQKFSETA